jgi:hypothetical protein
VSCEHKIQGRIVTSIIREAWQFHLVSSVQRYKTQTKTLEKLKSGPRDRNQDQILGNIFSGLKSTSSCGFFFLVKVTLNVRN